jgi:hypothetical protein
MVRPQLFRSVVRDFLVVVSDFLDLVDLRVVVGDAVAPVVFGDVADLVLGLLPGLVLVLGLDFEDVGLGHLAAHGHVIGFHFSAPGLIRQRRG